MLNAARWASGGQLENREIVVVVNVGRLAAATGRLAGEMFKLRQTWNNVSIRISAAAVQPSETDKTLSCQDPNFKPKEHKEFWLHDPQLSNKGFFKLDHLTLDRMPKLTGDIRSNRILTRSSG